MADMETYQIQVKADYIDELREEFETLKFERIEKKNGMYLTNPLILDMSNDHKIFIETQAKRTLRGHLAPFVSKAIKKKLSHFSQEEDKISANIYADDSAHDVKPGERYAIQNIGHSTQLIQVPYFNILTDPVMNSLNVLLYPAKTESRPEINKIVKIDVVLISHNHRDHVDTHSLKKIQQCHRENIWPLPTVLVPLGDKNFFEGLGYKDVEEVDWYTKIRFSKTIDGTDKIIDFVSIPSDHRSGRYGYDHHRSLVTGWLINSKSDGVIFKFAGDTKSLNRDNQMATDAVIWHEIKITNESEDIPVLHGSSSSLVKPKQEQEAIPNIICLEPSGPNYTRCYMDVTHQSTSYSALLKFREAENLGKISGKDSQEFLQKIKTVMIHHNKFELGPDRFNEGLFVFKKLIQYLDCKDLDQELEKQENKLNQHLDYKKLKKSLPFTSMLLISTLPAQTSLLIHAKDFVIRDIQDMLTADMSKDKVKEILLQNTIFPKIGKRMNDGEITKMKTDIESIHKYKRLCSNLQS